MAIEITLEDQTFEIPTSGERGYGNEVTNWILLANQILGQNNTSFTIPPTTANLTSGGNTNLYEYSAPQDNRNSIIEYGIYRTTSNTSTCETGVILLAYNPTTAAWQINNTSVGDSSVTFSMSGSNILVASTAALSGTGDTSTIQFSGRIIRTS